MKRDTTTAGCAATYVASLQPHVPGPVLAVGLFRRSRATAGSFRRDVVLALTERSLYLFEYRPGRRGTLKVKAALAVWHRYTFVTSVHGEGTLGARVRFHFADGRATQLDWDRAFGGEAFNGAILRLLTEPMMATASYPGRVLRAA